MPDDFSHLGYCGKCHAIHERDEDGLMCDDDRPLPVARVVKQPSWLQRFIDGLRKRLTARELVCGCCGMGYREHGPRCCRCTVNPDDPGACTVHGQ